MKKSPRSFPAALAAIPLGGDLSLVSLGSCGYYWSSPPISDYPDFACLLAFDSGYFSGSSYYRYCGLSVRPVRDAD